MEDRKVKVCARSAFKGTRLELSAAHQSTHRILMPFTSISCPMGQISKEEVVLSLSLPRLSKLSFIVIVQIRLKPKDEIVIQNKRNWLVAVDIVPHVCVSYTSDRT